MPRKANQETCENCGKRFPIAPSQKPKHGLLCSWDCRREFRKKHPLRIRPWEKVKCDGCGKEFERNPRNDDMAKKRGYKAVYCSRECYFEAKSPEECVDCGSRDLHKYKSNKSGNFVFAGRCHSCFRAHHRKIQTKVILTCKVCGFKKPDHGNIRVKDRPFWLCRECKRDLKIRKPGSGRKFGKTLYEKTCGYCGEKYEAGKHEKRVFCSMKCKELYHEKVIKTDRQKGFCVDCGASLKNATHAHLENHAACNMCMYLRRTRYKTKAAYGELWPAIYVARIGKNLSKRGLTAWQIQRILRRQKRLMEEGADLSKRLIW